MCADHVHLSVAIPPKISKLNYLGYLKGKSMLMIYDKHPELRSKWEKVFWARGYYVETIGNITDKAVQKYRFISGSMIIFMTPSCGVSSKISPLES